MKPQPIIKRLAAFALLACITLAAQLAWAQTIVWQDNFEGDSPMDNWTVDNGIWEIGVPTYGPPPGAGGRRAHQGTNCAATVLNGNYLDDRQSRLVYAGPTGQGLLVPAASENPRLRFWHWWSFAGGDFGQVQVSTNNGTSWYALSPKYGDDGVTYTYDSSGRWSRAWLDLKAYAGKTLLLALYFESHSWDVAPGWYVDDMVVETGPEPGWALPEGFESGWGGWKAQYAGGIATDFAIWEIGRPTSGPGAAHGGVNCAATILNGYYPDDRRSRLVGQPFVVPDASLSPRLRFWHWWSFAGGDFGQVQISTNNGASWYALSPKYGQDGVANNYNSSGKWTRGWLDLTAYAGKAVLLGLYFESHSWDVAPGWYVDDMMIETGPFAAMVFPEGFEDAAATDRWQADYGVWEIGTPTSGPGSAHGGSKCLATILSGNYTDDRRSRIVSKAFVIPGASENPRLRFWHWWSFAGGDFGQVQVSTNNGATWANLSPQYSASSGSWTYSPPFDLSSYGGRSVRISFYFESHSWDVAPGWYVDDITLLATGYPPMITAQPTNQTVVAGNPVSFAVAVSPLSSLPLSYQWRFNGSRILDATNTSYTIPSASTNDAGNYDIVVTNLYGSATSLPPATLTVLVRPTITLPPQSQNVIVGSNASFTVAAYGTEPLNYQWRFNGTNLSNGGRISGATTPTLGITGVQVSDTGPYVVVVSNRVGMATSTPPALLTVFVPPGIVTPPIGHSVAQGSNTTFTVVASGTEPLGYQWRHHGTNLPNGGRVTGATSPTLGITGAQTADAGPYFVVVSNWAGMATSAPPALLTVAVLPSITGLTMQPASPVVEGTNVTFCVTATGTEPMTYQWRRNGGSIAGAMVSCHTITNVQVSHAGAYSVAVSNAAGGLISGDLALAVLPVDVWRTNVIGATGDGSYSIADGVFTVNGSGEDVEGTKDDFFFVHKPLNGDGQIVARLLALLPADPNSEAGVMLRDGTNSGARHVFLPLDEGKHVSFRRRLLENDYAGETGHSGTNWTWLRLMRLGDTFVGHASTNGMDWSLVWWTTVLNMPTNLEAGLAVTAHKNQAMATAQFENVSTGPLVPLPGVWPEAGPRICLGGEAGAMAEFQRVGGFKALVGGAVGERYAIKSSAVVDASVASWLDLGTVTNTYGVVPFTDPQALTNANRFYRLQRVAP